MSMRVCVYVSGRRGGGGNGGVACVVRMYTKSRADSLASCELFLFARVKDNHERGVVSKDLNPLERKQNDTVSL